LPVAVPVTPTGPSPEPTLSAAADPDFQAPEGYVVEPDESDVVRVRGEGSLRRWRAARTRLVAWSMVLIAGVLWLAADPLRFDPDGGDGAGAVLVLASDAWAVMPRSGGVQVVFSAVAGVIGVLAVFSDGAVLRSGAALLTCVTSALLAVVLTVPA